MERETPEDVIQQYGSEETYRKKQELETKIEVATYNVCYCNGFILKKLIERANASRVGCCNSRTSARKAELKIE